MAIEGAFKDYEREHAHQYLEEPTRDLLDAIRAIQKSTPGGWDPENFPFGHLTCPRNYHVRKYGGQKAS
jgi:hypothetical protein